MSPTRDQVDGIPEHLHVDIESTLHGRLSDGSDEWADLITDVMAAITPLISRALAATQPQVLWEGQTVGRGYSSAPPSNVSISIPVRPGTRVRVVAAGGGPLSDREFNEFVAATGHPEAAIPAGAGGDGDGDTTGATKEATDGG